MLLKLMEYCSFEMVYSSTVTDADLLLASSESLDHTKTKKQTLINVWAHFTDTQNKHRDMAM